MRGYRPRANLRQVPAEQDPVEDWRVGFLTDAVRARNRAYGPFIVELAFALVPIKTITRRLVPQVTS